MPVGAVVVGCAVMVFGGVIALLLTGVEKPVTAAGTVFGEKEEGEATGAC